MKLRFLKHTSSALQLIAVLLFIIPLQGNNANDIAEHSISNPQQAKCSQLSYLDALLDFDEDESKSNHKSINNSYIQDLISSHFIFSSFLIPFRNTTLKFQQWSRGTFS